MQAFKAHRQLGRSVRGASTRSVQAGAAAKRVLITGGNTGIGYISAKELCTKGYDVTIACRDDGKAAAAKAKIEAAVPGAKIATASLDLADLASVRDAAHRILDAGEPFDVLLNNAGVMACPPMKTKQGYEYQLGVNHIGHFLLTTQLLPLHVAAGKPVRIVNVASLAHTFGKIDFQDMMCERNYNEWVAYGQSKLANIVFSYELARRLGPSSKITVNALHPGIVRTELGRYLLPESASWFAGPLQLLATPFTKSAEQGAETQIYLCSSPEVEGVTSKYWDNCKPIASTPESYDVDIARRFWQRSEELVAEFAK